MMVQPSGMTTYGQNEVKLIDRMWKETRAIHSQVEGRQFIQNLIHGQASPEAYLQYLVDLKCIYESLEFELDQNKSDSKISAIILPELFRSKKLDGDIKFFSEKSKLKELAPSKEAKDFIEVIQAHGANSVHKLAAYVYIRMLGDLFGGRDIGAAVESKWGQSAISFYNYEELMDKCNVESLPRFARESYRPKFNQLMLTSQEEEEVIKESLRAFELTDALLASYER